MSNTPKEPLKDLLAQRKNMTQPAVRNDAAKIVYGRFTFSPKKMEAVNKEFDEVAKQRNVSIETHNTSFGIQSEDGSVRREPNHLELFLAKQQFLYLIKTETRDHPPIEFIKATIRDFRITMDTLTYSTIFEGENGNRVEIKQTLNLKDNKDGNT